MFEREAGEAFAMSSTLDFVVTGEEKIHCAGCEARISHALKRLAGVRDVKASANEQRVVCHGRYSDAGAG
jgi:cation transport ATPase